MGWSASMTTLLGEDFIDQLIKNAESAFRTGDCMHAQVEDPDCATSSQYVTYKITCGSGSIGNILSSTGPSFWMAFLIFILICVFVVLPIVLFILWKAKQAALGGGEEE